MNNKSIKNLILSGVLAIAFISAHNAFAYVPGVWDPTTPVNPNPVFTTVVASPVSPIINPVTPTNPVTPIQPNTNPVKPVTPVTPANPVKPVINNNTNNLPPVNTVSNDNNGLTALSFRGSGGFMPSSVWQWLLVAFLILVIIIIARTLSKPKAHNPHAVGAH